MTVSAFIYTLSNSCVILTAIGEFGCYKMIFVAMLSYMIFIGTCGSLDFVALFSLTQNIKKCVYIKYECIYISIYVRIRIKYRKMSLPLIFVGILFSFVRLKLESWSIFCNIGKMGLSTV